MKKRIDKIPIKFRKAITNKIDRFAKAIQFKREKLGLTQEELSENLDISIETLKAIEQGRRYPSLPMLFYICEYLKIEVKIDS